MLWTYGALSPDWSRSFAPDADPDSEPFWQHLAHGRVTAQRCATCGAWRFPPGPRCRRCQASTLEWTQLTSTPRLYSWIVVNRPTHAEMVVPYAVCIAEFPERVRIPGQLVVPAGTDELVLDTELEAIVDVRDGGSRLLFRPAAPDAVDQEVVRSEVVEV
jgi:uncharacterized OB-fold protein